MSGDYSRERFDPRRHFETVLMQQGRVQLDADWNEFAAMLTRRLQATTLDTIGRVAVPRQPSDALGPTSFRIGNASAAGFDIGPGRAWVDGLLAENFGTAPLFDTRMAELAGSAALAFMDQPYRRNLQPLELSGGTHLVYLDLWRREVGPLQQPDLVEPALGVDTTTRSQLIWQLRVLEGIAAASCAGVLEDPAWRALTAAPAARLSSAANGVASAMDPCLIPPTGGYKGLENRLYRVEVHAGNGAGAASFKWSRDNANVASLISEVAPTLDAIVVDSLGRDAVLSFQPGDWIEITDDEHEFEGLPGALRRIVEVDPATRRLTLNAALPAGEFQVTAKKAGDPPPQLRATRWDQSGRVLDGNGELIVDLDDAAATGSIPLQPGVVVRLEDGVEVRIDLDPAGGPVRSGDYWTFAARVADASVEVLDRAPPRGIHHHYAPLARLGFNANGAVTVSDCRVFWPPISEGGGGDCACTVCVSAEQHNSNTLTIAQAIAQVSDSGGTVCLGPGEFFVRETIFLDDPTAVRVRGHGMSTRLMLVGAGPIMEVYNAISGFTLEDLMMYALPQPNAPLATLLAIDGGEQVAIRRCAFLFDGAGNQETAITLTGSPSFPVIQDCVIGAPRGICNPQGTTAAPVLAATQLRIADNAILCGRVAIDLGSPESMYIGQAAIHRNMIFVERGEGVLMAGRTQQESGLESGLDCADNTIMTAGNGVQLQANTWAVRDNLIISGESDNADTRPSAILVAGQDGLPLNSGHISGNRVRGYTGSGVLLSGGIESLTITANDFSRLGSGIASDTRTGPQRLSVRDNQFRDLASDFNSRGNSRGSDVAGLDLVGIDQLSVAGNRIDGFATGEGLADLRAAIRCLDCGSVELRDNQLVNIGPARNFSALTWGIAVLGATRDVQLTGNQVHRALAPEGGEDGPSSWLGIFVGAADEDLMRQQIQLCGSSPNRGDEPAEVSSQVLSLLRRGALAVVPVAINGNRVLGYGRLPAIAAWSGADLQCGHSRCQLSQTDQQAALWLVGSSLSATSNHVSSNTDRLTAWLFARDTGSFTALGNLVSQQILFNAAALGNPWNTLNARI